MLYSKILSFGEDLGEVDGERRKLSEAKSRERSDSGTEEAKPLYKLLWKPIVYYVSMWLASASLSYQRQEKPSR